MHAMGRESIRVTRSVTLDPGEIDLRTSRSSGPGGQHANTAETRVEAVFDVDASPSLTARQKRRVIARSGPVLRAVAQDERSQARNREVAVERLVAKLAAALRVERRRVPTRPTEASRHASAGSSPSGAAPRSSGTARRRGTSRSVS
jgi:ribosome-associated protein